MPLQLAFEVPIAAKSAAERALKLHRDAPLEDVHGLTVAEALVSGVVALDTIARLCRFFRVNGRVYEAELQGLRTEQDSSLCRSWMLHGAESGRVWAEALHRRAVSEGYVAQETTTDLLRSEPDEIYAAFSLGAWRFEYDLDPRKAARFVEEYHRATGWNLDLRRAFGDSAGAVGNALYRRFHPVDPFKEAARCLQVEDAEYRLAATVDLQEITDSFDALEEGLKPAIYVAQANVTAKLVWPGFVAYVILAVERPDLLVEMNKASQKPPLQNQKPKPFASYSDPIWTYIAFFHENGVRFIDPKKGNDATAKAFGTLPEDMEDMMTRAYYGRTINSGLAQKLLGRARRWTAENKFAGSLFHVFNADWKKGNWQHILESIPEDHDIRPAFAEFVKQNPLPSAGVKLQQTLSDKFWKQKVASYLYEKEYVASSDPDDLKPVKINDTQAGQALIAKGTPIGVYSLIEHESYQSKEKHFVLGAFKHVDGTVTYVFAREPGGLLNHGMDSSFKAAVNANQVTVLLAHKDMPGSSYVGKVPKPPASTSAEKDPEAEPVAPASPFDPEFIAFLKKHGATKTVKSMTAVDITKTKFYAAATKKYGPVIVGGAWRFAIETPPVSLRLHSAYRSPADVIVFSVSNASVPDFRTWVDSHAVIHVGSGKLYPKEAAADGQVSGGDKNAQLIKDVNVMVQAAQKLAIDTTTDITDWMSIGFTDTLLAGAAFNAGYPTPATGQDWMLYGKPLRLVGALSRSGSTHIVGVRTGGKLFNFGDTSAAYDVKMGAFHPVGLQPKSIEPVQQATVVAPTPVPSPFALLPGEIVAWAESNWLIMGELTEGSQQFYVAQELWLSAPDAMLHPTKVLRSAIESAGKLVGTASSKVLLAKHFKFGVSMEPSTYQHPDMPIGATYADGTKWTLCLFRDTDNGPLALLLTDASYNFGGQSMSGVMAMFRVPDWLLTHSKTSSYAPTDPAPESSHEDDEPDPEQGSFEMSGTLEAFAYLQSRGWHPAVKSESPHFEFSLGSLQDYKLQKTRLIIGYGRAVPGQFVYVTRTEQGNVGWVTALNGNQKYGPLLSMDKATVAALLPKPGEKAKQKFPKLNYKLSSLAKQVAQQHNLIFVSSPSDTPFKAGTPLFALSSKQKVVLLGWTQGGSGVTLAVIFVENSEDPFNYTVVSQKALVSSFSLRYKNWSAYVMGTGEITFGKHDEKPNVSVSGPVPLPSEPKPGWDDPAPINQPPFAEIPKGKHVAAGVVALLPAGLSINYAGDLYTTSAPSVALYFPLGGYGGYHLNIPKGTVEAGESVLKAAVREVHEETGLTVKPVAHLGDFRGNQSVTRLFIGVVTGGNPHQKKSPEECDAVTFKPLTPNYKESSWYKQLVPESGNPWQQLAIDKAYDWIQEHGFPGNVQPATQTQDASVAHASDVPDPFAGVSELATKATTSLQDLGTKFAAVQQAASWFKKSVSSEPVWWKPSIPPTDIDKGDVWKALLFKSPFPITNQMVELLKKEAAATGSGQPVSFDVARERSIGPKYGQSFETEQGTPYVAHGYVSWVDTSGHDIHFLLAFTPGGSVEILLATKEGLQAKVSSDQTLANAPQDAWYTHPDPTINATIQAVFKSGTLEKSGVNIQTFKVKWMKDAGMPAYAVITQPLLRDVCSLFVPGAASQAQYETIVGCLKARMKATHSGKKSSAVAPVASTGTVVAPAPLPVPVPYIPKPIVTIGPLSPILRQYVNTPQPHLFSATGTGVKGGSKPNMLLNGPGGKQWFAKYAPGEDWRSYIDRAAYQLSELCKENNVPVGVMEFDGKTVSYQPYAPNAAPPPADPTELDDDNAAELLSQHAVDMFMGDHDGHAGNWISVGGRIIAVDRGQAFKFVLMGKDESLDPYWHAPGNFGDGYAKRLLISWSEGKVEIPTVAWSAMRKSIRGVQSITDTQLTAVLTPVLNAMSLKAGAGDAALTTLKERRDSYEKDWTTVLRKLRKDFKWPATKAGLAAPVKVFTSSPKDLAFGKREEKTIADATAARWQGKSVRMGGLVFENQEVMVRRVQWEQQAGVKVPATLIHFRVLRPAGVEAAKKLYQFSGLDFTESMGGPQRLKADHKGGYWEKIYAAVKTLNHHLHVKKDLEVNQQTITQMSELRPELEHLTKVASNAHGAYAPTNESNEAVYAMAEQYLQYLGIVEYWNAKKAELVGQHSPTLLEFLWEPPQAEKPETAGAAYKIALKKQGALWPTAAPVGQDVVVTNLNKPVMNSASQSQFVIEDPLTKARVFWNPPGGLHHSGLENVKDGVESLKGQGWAIMPGEPSPGTVAHLLKLFQDATGLTVRAATKEDDTVLYWSRQAQVLQGDGAVQPKADHTTVVEKGYEAALAEYANGNNGLALAKLKVFVADKLGKSLDETEALASGPDIEGSYTRGAGYLRHTRIGWTRTRLKQVMGQDCRVAHHLAEPTGAWMQQMGNNGALLANAIKPYYGVTKTGASPGEDMNRGGGQGLFLCFRKGIADHAGMIYFDISLALRLDIYIVGTGDTYGDTGQTRYSTPEQWVKLNAHKGSGYTSASSPLQVSVRHDIDLREYLVAAVCSSSSERTQCIKIADSLGWTFYGGAKPEEVFRE